ncbi:nucleotide-binding universal stress UspA family protein [Streptomyces sp. B4I13]|uniref:universal stress protein n=1 Tax=Streptomyces sp. B4I13 TaxID=3042271 RepID=UPI0027897F31|nr:universal stress protein [Streptomyces sp. B4I13]MDQ0958145.1 nucleotide-binding universal stress UspA family protein [Streptomyces sp. B4I13]
MLKPVVAGLDGWRESAAAADWAAREALRRGLPLRLVHAWEGLSDEEAALPELKVPQYRARRILRGAMDRLTERYPQVYISAEQLRLSPARALESEAEEAELLVLGSQGFGAVGGFFAGSVAMATVAHVQRPVVLVRAGNRAEDERFPDADGRPPDRTPYRVVVLAVDLDDPCDTLIGFGFEAAACRNATLRVVYVRHTARFPSATAAPARDMDQAEADRALGAALQPWREKFPTVRVQALAVNGGPAQGIMKASRDAGLLVVGRRPRHAAVGARTGPVAHAVIHHVGCPVAVVPHD